MRVKRDSVVELAAYADRRAVPIVHFSTDYVFSGSADAPYVETGTTYPNGVYRLSKLAGEQATVTASRHVIVRVSWVFAYRGANFVRTVIRLAADREVLRRRRSGRRAYLGWAHRRELGGFDA